MKYIQLFLAALLLLCLAKMPYGYYNIIRLIAMTVFVYMAYVYTEKKKLGLMVTFGALVLLFQPFVKIAIGRTMWNIVDVAVAILLITLTIIDFKK
ncbi:MAG: DUF6804 family protein [Bacteroidaceae bacterium]